MRTFLFLTLGADAGAGVGVGVVLSAGVTSSIEFRRTYGKDECVPGLLPTKRSEVSKYGSEFVPLCGFPSAFSEYLWCLYYLPRLTLTRA